MKHDMLVKAYIDALDLAAVLILAAPGGRPAKIGTEPAPDLELFDTFWFAKPQHVELVLAQCPDGLVDRSAAELRDQVINAAAALGASWRTTVEVDADADLAVEQIVENVERERIKGGLRQVNAGYKTYRHCELSAGKKPIGYGDYLVNFTRDIVVLAARNQVIAGRC